MRFLRNKKGFTLIELIVAMVVFAILGGAVAGMIQAGLGSYGRISDDMYTETEARTALSLVTVQIRQHDATDAISVNSDTAIGFMDAPPLPGGTVIWFSGDTLYTREATDVTISQTDSDDYAIAKILDFRIVRNPSGDGLTFAYTVTVTYGSAGGDEKELSQTITQRSTPATPSPSP